jgi:hypothetical protein
MAKVAFSDVRRALTWGMGETAEGKPYQFVTLVDSDKLDEDMRQPRRKVAPPCESIGEMHAAPDTSKGVANAALRACRASLTASASRPWVFLAAAAAAWN